MASTRKSPSNRTLFARVTEVVARHVHRGERVVAGLSGGIDSVVLLDILARARKKSGFDLAALHVNHQINPAADAWARTCRRFCGQLDVPLTVVKVKVPKVASLEAAARAARYAALARVEANFIALAHNLDDQAETLMLQLLRGAGVKGVSAMPVLRKDANAKLPPILRPLLDVPRSDIEKYAAARKLKWVEDDSNSNLD